MSQYKHFIGDSPITSAELAINQIQFSNILLGTGQVFYGALVMEQARIESELAQDVHQGLLHFTNIGTVKMYSRQPILLQMTMPQQMPVPAQANASQNMEDAINMYENHFNDMYKNSNMGSKTKYKKAKDIADPALLFQNLLNGSAKKSAPKTKSAPSPYMYTPANDELDSDDIDEYAESDEEPDIQGINHQYLCQTNPTQHKKPVPTPGPISAPAPVSTKNNSDADYTIEVIVESFTDYGVDYTVTLHCEDGCSCDCKAFYYQNGNANAMQGQYKPCKHILAVKNDQAKYKIDSYGTFLTNLEAGSGKLSQLDFDDCITHLKTDMVNASKIHGNSN